MTLWAVACQVSLSMGFSRQKYWSGLPCPPPGDLPNQGIEIMSLMSPALAGRFFTASATREARFYLEFTVISELYYCFFPLAIPLSLEDELLEANYLVWLTLGPSHSGACNSTHFCSLFPSMLYYALFIWLCCVLVAACRT